MTNPKAEASNGSKRSHDQVTVMMREAKYAG